MRENGREGGREGGGREKRVEGEGKGERERGGGYIGWKSVWKGGERGRGMNYTL